LIFPKRKSSSCSLPRRFLDYNVLVECDITPDDIEARLIGDWGTCPGLVIIYAHLNRLICKTDLNVLYVVRPGQHAHCVLTCVANFLRPRTPRILSSLWIKDSLSALCPQMTGDCKGLKKLIASFSVWLSEVRFTQLVCEVVRATLSSVWGVETSGGIRSINIGTRMQERKYHVPSRGIRREERMRIPMLGENLYSNW
jgi:hypothetical protein